MHEDEIEIYCEYCDAKHYIPFNESFKTKEFKCYSCNRTFYWYHCPKCETGFTSKYGNPMCIECHFGIDIQNAFDKGAVAFTGTKDFTNSSSQMAPLELKYKKNPSLEKSPTLAQKLFCLQCPICDRWHSPFSGMGMTPIMCKCGANYYIKGGFYLVIFFTILLVGAYVHTKFPAEYKTKLFSICYLIFLFSLNLILAPRVTHLEDVYKKKE